MEYFLMNKDEKLISFETREQLGATVINDYKILYNILPPGFTDIETWIEHRNYAKHKNHMKQWLHEWGIDTTDGFLQVTHALGVNDTLWVKRKDSNLQWNDVNLYKNKFTDISCTTAFETGLHGLQLSSITPEFTTDGTFPKCWINKADGIYILKQSLSGAVNTGYEAQSEYISSQIGYKIFPDTVPYDLVLFKKKLCSQCRLFTTEQTGYIPFGKTVNVNKHYTIAGLLTYFADYDAANHTKFLNKFRTMIVLDSIVFNHDRHLNNFGFLFDNETFRITDFAPLFDFNFSFLCSLTTEELINYRENMIKYDIGHKLGGSFNVVGKEILTPELRDKMPVFLDIPKHEFYNMPRKRVQLLEDIFQENYNQIRNGKTILQTPAKPYGR